MPPEQQPPTTPAVDTTALQGAVQSSQTIMAPDPIKKKSHLVFWLILGFVGFSILLAVMVIVLVLMSLKATAPNAQNDIYTSTPCYSLNTTGLKPTTNNCDLKTLVDNGGYFEGIEILTYQENSYGTFEDFKVGYEKDLRADPKKESITVTTTTIDGLDAVRYEYQRAPTSNVVEFTVGAEEGFRTTYYELWVDVEGNLGYNPDKGGPIKAFSIKGSNATQSVEQTFNTSLDSIRWIKN
jgi:hypothetical protein